ncbi:MAG TPA: endolytic transglycosylase MltG [Candidatus Limnocylindrales bacterium]
MTLRGGHKPRGGRGPSVGPKDEARRIVVDAGWDDYLPPLPEEIAVRRSAGGRQPSRDYKKSRAAGNGRKLRFALFAAVIGGLVLGGLNFVVKPAVLGGVVDWAAQNPTALKLPFVADIVRGELSTSLTQPIDATDASVIVIVIAPDATPADVGAQLLAAGAITDVRAFVFEAIQKGVTAQFQVGRHEVAKSLTMDQIIVKLTTPPVAAPLVKLVFREGLRLEQMVAEMEDIAANPTDKTAPLKMNVSQFYDLVAHPPAEIVGLYPWLKLPAGASLEGFLFPATYEVKPDITPDQLVKMLLDAFASHAPEGLLKLAPEAIYQKVQLASLVETEAKVESDRALIAGVYTNRLNPKMWPTGLLNADPTLNYANDSVWLQANPIESWVSYYFWKPISTSGPLSQVVFPGTLASYNTYHHAGLPPTPICSPSAASLVAAMTPDTADGYLFFLAKGDGSGTHAFAKTQAEQDANAKLYGYGQ